MWGWGRVLRHRARFSRLCAEWTGLTSPPNVIFRIVLELSFSILPLLQHTLSTENLWSVDTLNWQFRVRAKLCGTIHVPDHPPFGAKSCITMAHLIQIAPPRDNYNRRYDHVESVPTGFSSRQVEIHFCLFGHDVARPFSNCRANFALLCPRSALVGNRSVRVHDNCDQFATFDVLCMFFMSSNCHLGMYGALLQRDVHA